MILISLEDIGIKWSILDTWFNNIMELIGFLKIKDLMPIGNLNKVMMSLNDF